MRKSRLRLIKKTERWLHRKRGTDTLGIPTDIDTDRISRFVILGSADGEDEGMLSGVGDYDEASGKYVIGIHTHGKNLLGGAEFAAIHMSKQIATVSKPSLSATNYIFTADAGKDGVPIIDRSVIKFKERTAYTITFAVRYLNAIVPRDLRLTFNYTDGTSYTPTFNTALKNLSGCASSDPEKTVAYISHYPGDNKAINYTLASFGIYEGVYATPEEIHEPYVGERRQITLDAPLYSIGYASDELDLKSGTLRRKVRKLRIDASAEVEATDTEGVFAIPLDAPARVGSYAVRSALPDESGEGCEVSVSDGGASILIRPPGELTEVSEAISYLEGGAFDLYYILSVPEVTDSGIECPSLMGRTAVDLLCGTPPRKCYVEYY